MSLRHFLFFLFMRSLIISRCMHHPLRTAYSQCDMHVLASFPFLDPDDPEDPRAARKYTSACKPCFLRERESQLLSDSMIIFRLVKHHFTEASGPNESVFGRKHLLPTSKALSVSTTSTFSSVNPSRDSCLRRRVNPQSLRSNVSSLSSHTLFTTKRPARCHK